MPHRTGPSRLPPLALAYHGVADVPLREDPSRLFMRPSDLRWQVARLRSWGYRLTSFGDLARRAAAGAAGGWAALTFDDGLADNLHALVPVLRELEAPATVFVASGLVGGYHPDAPAHPMLTPSDVVDLAAAGVEIGGHSTSHVDLTSLSYDDALAELTQGRAQLEALVDRPVDLLAYPYGKADDLTVAAARAAGYTSACLTCGEGSWSDPFRLPRQAMNNRDTLLGLWLKRHDRFEQLMRPVRPLLRHRYAGRFIGASRRLRSASERLRQGRISS